MDEPVTLLAHLMPRLTTPVEDAATDENVAVATLECELAKELQI